MTPTLYSIAVVGGQAFAGGVKFAFKPGWRRLSAPRGRHRH
jgi:hypothetical protein